MAPSSERKDWPALDWVPALPVGTTITLEKTEWGWWGRVLVGTKETTHRQSDLVGMVPALVDNWARGK